MCGITGIVASGPINPDWRGVLREMTRRLEHRGPDEAGEYIDGRAMLGHRRLSIVGLESGRQPVSNEDGTILAVVNGEFYDFLNLRETLISRGHTFKTTSDAECIVHLYEDYGERCVEHVGGMFALAIWDARRGKLLLARDRLGVKPLYYAAIGDVLAFASELKSLLAIPGLERRIDATALLDYLVFDFIPSPKTIFSGIRKLAPGTRLILEAGRAVAETYWDLQSVEPLSHVVDETASRLWSELSRATRIRMAADVPVGALLSGGIDSGAVAAAMSRLSREPITTVTSGFGEQSFDERGAARETAQCINARHFEHVVNDRDAGVLETLAWHFDEPFADPSAIPMLALSRHARRHVKVALSGDGGDEILAGYRRYRFDLAEDSVRRHVPARVRRALFGGLTAIWPTAAWLPRPLRAAATFRNLAEDAATAHGLSIAAMCPQGARALLNGDLTSACEGYDPLDHVRLLHRRCPMSDHLSKCQYVDIKLGLADGILTKVDRASMACGLEVRSPMLDYRFVEFCWRIPPSQRIMGSRGKAPLRAALASEMGPAFAARRKAGFDVPLDDWIAGGLRPRIESELLADDAAVGQWLSTAAMHRIWREHRDGRRQHGALLWKMLMLNTWGGQFMRSELLASCSHAPQKTDLANSAVVVA